MPRPAESIEVPLPPALAAFVLVLVAARELDERAASRAPHATPGLRSLEAIGRAMASVPGPENAVEPETVGGYKRALMRRVRAAVRARGLRVRPSGAAPGDPSLVPPPVENPGYGLGYALHGGLRVQGVDVDALVAAVGERVPGRQLSPRPGGTNPSPAPSNGPPDSAGPGSGRVFAPPSIRC